MHFEATYLGLQKWHCHMFERYGWLILAKAHGFNHKVVAYKKSLEILKQALQDKISTIRSQDKRDDLNILLANVNLLTKAVAKM